ncbi:MAG: TatD family hydrolase [Candidatus Taylorbacteria bacterium]|nr:TatD family hydrolase [Candidatus Taylorbacteria bacterium]
MSTIFDSHCHPQFPQYDKDREKMLARAFGAGVSMICVGTDLEMSKKGIELAQKHNNMWATVGLHPNDIPDDFEVMIYHNFLQNPKVVAIGEVGLDYYRTPEPEKQKKQKEVFEQFIDLAQRTKKPMVLHFRDSPKGSSGRVHKDALAMLPKDIAGVSHSFTGSLDEAKEYLNRGMYLGFNGIITFANQYDEVVRYAPLEQILLETDAPYLTPEPYRTRPPAFTERFGRTPPEPMATERGRVRNEPAYVIEVAKKVSELKKEPLEKVIEVTTTNCKKLFRLV